ncbi:MAG TPA: alpha/beta fold hydrolase [Rhodoglobus sp.]|nr:alpha/beta fold hydrolase [Rhodoglobus sp.]
MTRRALLVHGLSSDSSSWWRVRTALEADGWDVVAPDLLGHGGRPASSDYSLAAYAGDLPTGPWDAVIGHSLGGAATVLAAQRSGFARRIVLLDPVLEVRAEDEAATIADQISELTLDEASIAAAKPHWHERDREAKLRGVRTVDPAAVERSFTDNRPWDVTEAARSLATPVLVLMGDPSVYTMLDPATAATLPAEVRVVAGAGHAPHRDRPAETLAAIRSFLAG